MMATRKRHGKSYKDRSAKSQLKIDRRISIYYGDSKSDRERALRDLRNGTWHPSARKKTNQVPQRITRQALNYPEFLPSGVGEDLRDAAFRNMDAQLGYHVNKYGEIGDYNAFTVAEGIGEANIDALVRLASASESQLVEMAAYQADKNHPGKPQKGTPKYIREMGWTDSSGNWHNLAWYH